MLSEQAFRAECLRNCTCRLFSGFYQYNFVALSAGAVQKFTVQNGADRTEGVLPWCEKLRTT